MEIAQFMIIVGFMGLGVLVGLLIGGNTANGGHMSAALMAPIGAFGAFGYPPKQDESEEGTPILPGFCVK